jgi:HTH-type transcriptional regulator / antitoxin HipB
MAQGKRISVARIDSGEPGVAIGHVLGMLALYGISVKQGAK